MMARLSKTMMHWKMPTVMTLTVAATLITLTVKATTEVPAQEATQQPPGEPIMAIVSIKSQRVSLYDANRRIMHAPVSTGVPGRETPAGIFSVLEKNKEHRSNMYDDASMPNMQRITWNGIAMHAGPLPGYPASHGCIRLPSGFSARLFNKTRIGMRVIISPNDTAPVEISHPQLFSPDPEIVSSLSERAKTFKMEAAEAVKELKQAKKTVKSIAGKQKAKKRALSKLKKNRKRANVRLKKSINSIAAAKKAKAKATVKLQKASEKAATMPSKVAAAKSALKSKVDALAAAKNEGGGKKAVNSAARAVTKKRVALRKIQALKKRADAALKRASKALTSADKSLLRANKRRQQYFEQYNSLGTRIEGANFEMHDISIAVTEADKALEDAQSQKEQTAQAALDAKLALEPVSVYISRANDRVYVRRNTHKPAPDGGGFVYDSSIEAPISIRDSYEPIGTHIFTAMEQTDSGLRWTAVTIDGGDPKAALDRITFPEEVLARIAPTALPRSSIIISDEPLSEETNYRTEFVAILRDQPHGGFITREVEKKTVSVEWGEPSFLDH